MTETNSTFLVLSWRVPGRPNGVVTRYDLIVTLEGSSMSPMTVTFSGSALSGMVQNLSPARTYSLELVAHTKQGRTQSTAVTATTLEDGTV